MASTAHAGVSSSDTASTSGGRTRHRRTPSQPLRVRTVSISHPASPGHTGRPKVEAEAEHSLSTVLSPTSADLPSAFPSTAPQSPQKASEKYGFVVYVGSLVAWYLYLVWAFVPDSWLRAIGIEWYPNREWAILVPSWIMVAVVFVYVAYFSLNLYNTPPLDSLTVLTDLQGHIMPPQIPSRSAQGSALEIPLGSGESIDYEDPIPPLYDIPVTLVNRALFEADEA